LRDRGWKVNRKRVQRLMREDNLLCVVKRRFVVTTDSAHSSQARSDRHRTSLLGVVRYIEKPSQLEEFLSTVGRAVKEMLHA